MMSDVREHNANPDLPQERDPPREREPPAVTRLRRRLLAPLVRAGEITGLLVAVRGNAARSLQARLARLADMSGTAVVAPEAQDASRADRLRERWPPQRQRRGNTEGTTPPPETGDSPSTRFTGDTAQPADAGEGPSQAADTALRPVEVVAAHSAGQQESPRQTLSPAELAALERAARLAAEDALRPLRHDQRALAEGVRACRDQPPAFQ